MINSLRKFDVERQPFMDRSCDSRAGYKHHLTKDYLIHLKQSVMDMCRREQRHQVDLLTPAEKKITDREYHANRRGQKKLDARNEKMRSEGIAPRKTKYQTQKEFLRTAIENAASSACTLEEFQKLLMEKYHVTLKISRGRFSYLHPERNKPITGRNLGTHYEKDYLVSLLEENAERKKSNSTPEPSLPDNLTSDSRTSTQEPGQLEMPAFIFIKSDLRSTKQRLKEINEQIHYTGQYLANKSVYSQYLKSKNKKKFRQEHQSEFTLYETDRKILKERSDGEKLPSMKILKAEKEKLAALKNSQYEIYQNLRGYQNELKTVCSNVDMILGKDHAKQHEREKIMIYLDLSIPNYRLHVFSASTPHIITKS